MIKGRIDVDVEEQRKGCKEDMELSVVANHDRRYSGESAGRVRRTVRGWRDKIKSWPRKLNFGDEIFYSIYLYSR
jgi:hypothetical protein